MTHAAVPDELLARIRRFHDHTFPGVQEQFQTPMAEGQHPTILFIGCSDSRLVRNVGAFGPPYDGSAGFHGTSAVIEFAVLNLKVSRIVVCGHSHCDGIRALYEEVHPQTRNLGVWLELGREAVLPLQVTEEALRRTEQRAVVLQLERLMGYPMARAQVEAGLMTLHDWHYVIEDGEIHVFDVNSSQFIPRFRGLPQRPRTLC